MTKPSTQTTGPQPPSESERRAIGEASERIAGKHPRLVARIETDDRGILVVGPEHGDHLGWTNRLEDHFGSRGLHFPTAQLDRIVTFCRSPDGKSDSVRVNAILAAIEAVRPSNEIEASLALQMALTHELTLQAVARAQTVDTVQRYQSAAGMALKLMRTYTMQVEALAKLQRGGEQVVKVVHVHPGGQAIVGNVSAGGSRPDGGGGSIGNGDQPHAKALSAPTVEPLPPLWSEDAEREPVPVAGREGQDPLPDARRRQG